MKFGVGDPFRCHNVTLCVCVKFYLIPCRSVLKYFKIFRGLTFSGHTVYVGNCFDIKIFISIALIN